MAMERQKLLIRGLSVESHYSHLQTLSLFLENCSGIEIDLEEGENIQYGQAKTCAIVSFNEDIEDFESLKTKIEKKSKDVDLSVEQVPLLDGILVTGIPVDVSDDFLCLYFENSKRSSGGSIKDHSYNQGGHYAVLQYDNRTVVPDVLSKKHYLNGHEVCVQGYYPCLGVPEHSLLASDKGNDKADCPHADDDDDSSSFKSARSASFDSQPSQSSSPRSKSPLSRSPKESSASIISSEKTGNTEKNNPAAAHSLDEGTGERWTESDDVHVGEEEQCVSGVYENYKPEPVYTNIQHSKLTTDQVSMDFDPAPMESQLKSVPKSSQSASPWKTFVPSSKPVIPVKPITNPDRKPNAPPVPPRPSQSESQRIGSDSNFDTAHLSARNPEDRPQMCDYEVPVSSGDSFDDAGDYEYVEKSPSSQKAAAPPVPTRRKPPVPVRKKPPSDPPSYSYTDISEIQKNGSSVDSDEYEKLRHSPCQQASAGPKTEKEVSTAKTKFKFLKSSRFVKDTLVEGCRVEFIDSDSKIKISGSNEDAANDTLLKLYEKINNLVEEKCPYRMTPKMGKLLNNPQAKQLLESEFRKIGLDSTEFVYDIPTTGEPILLCGNDGEKVQRASQHITHLLNECEFNVPKPSQVVMKTHPFSKVIDALKSDLLAVEVDNTVVYLEGFKDAVTKAKKEMEDFFKRNTTEKIQVKATRGEIAYLKQHGGVLVQKVKDAGTWDKTLVARIDFSMKDGHVEISGVRDVVQQTKRELEKAIKTIEYLKFTITELGMGSFLASDIGKSLLRSIDTDNKCIVYLEIAKVKPQPTRRDPPPKPTPQPEASGGQRKKNELKAGNVTITLRKGDITADKISTVLVNVVGKELDLQHGVMAKQFLRVGGEELQEELEDQGPASAGDVVKTSKYGNFSQNCKQIYHAVLPPIGRGGNPKVLSSIVSKCLKMAHDDGNQSIAFPSLGCGNLRYRPDIVAKCMFDEACSFSAQYRSSKLKYINFVVYDASVLSTFEDEMDSRTGATSARSYQRQNSDDDTPIDPRFTRVQTSSSTVTIHLFAADKKTTSIVKDKIMKMVKDNMLSDTVTDKSIKHLPKREIERIAKMAEGPDVGVKIDKEAGKLTLYGEQKAVLRAKTEVVTSLSQQIEQQGGRQHLHRKEIRGNRVEYLNAIVDEPFSLCPHYWTSYDPSFKNLAKGIKNKVTGKKCSLKKVDDKINKAVTEMCIKTFDTQYVGAGRDAANLGQVGYSSINITKVERIENSEIYDLYAGHRKKLCKEALRGDIKPMHTLRSKPVREVDTHKFQLQHFKDYDLVDEINEVYLFHGTVKDNVDIILEKGPDFRVGGEGGMFGKGIYTAERFSKGDQYTDPRDQRRKNNLQMIVMRVLLGKVYSCKDPNVTSAAHQAEFKDSRPPCMKGCAAEKRCHHDRFDSVVGEIPGKNFREFVVYSQSQMYPEFLVSYDRV